MISMKLRKNSILALAVAALLSAALWISGMSFARADVNSAGLHYVDGGDAAYAYAVASEDEAAQSKLADISVMAYNYHERLGAFDEDNGAVDDAAELADEYIAFKQAVEEYNLTAGDGHTVSIPAEYVYGDTRKSTDSVKTATDMAIASLENAAEDWAGATEYDYSVKYAVKKGNEVLFDIYTSETGEPLIITVSEACEFIENKAKNGTVEIVFDLSGKTYTVLASLDRQDAIGENLATVRTYDVVLISVYEGNTSDKNKQLIYSKAEGGDTDFAVAMDEEYKVVSATVGQILAEAKSYFGSENPQDIAEKYSYYRELIDNKIAAVKDVACGKIDGTVNDIEEDLYSADAIGEIEGFADEGKGAIAEAGTYADMLTAAGFALDGIASVMNIPDTVRENYADILVKDMIYPWSLDADGQFARAVDACNYIASNNAKVREALANEDAALKANIRNSAIAAVNDKADGVNTSVLADNQVREIANRRQQAIVDVNRAGTNVNAIRNAVDTFGRFVDGTVSAYATKNLLEDGNIKIEGVFDSNATLSGSASDMEEESEELAEAKKKNAKSRRLSYLEAFGINITVNGAAVLSEAGNGEYTVTVKLSENTIELLKSSGVDAKSLIVAFADDKGNIELYNASLILKYEDGTTVTYDGETDVKTLNIAEGYIMFVTKHFSTYYLMGNTGNLALSRLTGLLGGIITDGLPAILIGLGAVVGAVLLFLLIAFIVSLNTNYTIKFISNGGSKVKSIRKRYGKKLPELPVSEKEGFVFGGWRIDKSLKYPFNRNVMPRANVKLYAKWYTPEEFEEMTGAAAKARLVGYYDALRAKLSSYKKVLAADEKSFVEQEILAKLYVEGEEVNLLLKTKLAFLCDCEDGKTRIVADGDKFECTKVIDDTSYAIAVQKIEEMAELHGLEGGELPEVEPSSYDDAVLGFAYAVTFDSVADFDERYYALRAFAKNFEVYDEKLPENGKLLFELIPNDKESLELGLALDADRYSEVLAVKETGGELNNVYSIIAGENMGVAFELIERVMNENGFAVSESEEELDTEEFSADEAFKYVICIEDEEGDAAAEEPVDLFRQLRLCAASFELVLGENPDYSMNGYPVMKAVKGEDGITVTFDPSGNAEEMMVSDADQLAKAEAKLADIMSGYGFAPTREIPEDTELVEATGFIYKIKFPEEPTPEEMLSDFRAYVCSFAMFAEEGAEVDKSCDGKVLARACLNDGVVSAVVDPEGEAQEFVIDSEEKLSEAKAAVDKVMAQYGLEKDPDYSSEDQAEGNGFGYRIKF